MRLLVEIFIIGALIYLGWEKTFSQRVDEIRGVTAATPPPTPAPVAVAKPTSAPVIAPAPVAPAISPAAAQSSVTPKSGAWMFDPNHHSPLDPTHKPATPSPR